MQEFLTGDIWNKINTLIRREPKRIVCVAYVTTNTVDLSNGDILICDASDHAIKCGQTSATILKQYFEKVINIFCNSQLHSKFLMTENLLAVGSSNLSYNSAEYLIESAILTSDESLIAQAKAFTHNLIKESAQLDSLELTRLLTIKVTRRKPKHQKPSNTRKMKFGKHCWYIPVHPLGDRSYEAISSDVETITRTVAVRDGIDEENVGFIRWNASSGFARDVQPGEQIIMRYTNKGKTRSHVYPPVAILEKKVAGKYIYLYYDGSDTEERKISWSKFKSLSKDFGLEKQYANRTKTLSVNDKEKIRSLFSK